jgi:hypothetical protein
MKAKIRAILDAKSVGAVERKAEREAKRMAHNAHVREYARKMREGTLTELPKHSPLFKKRQNRQEDIAA